ncbi:hypothetical protein ACS0TY_019107 [Phlomoides rotata]
MSSYPSKTRIIFAYLPPTIFLRPESSSRRLIFPVEASRRRHHSPQRLAPVAAIGVMSIEPLHSTQLDLAFDLSLSALGENIYNFGELLAHPIDLAFDLSLSALLGENIYNFGELLAHPIMKRLPNLENAYGFIDDPLKQSCITFTNSLLAKLNLRRTLAFDGHFVVVSPPDPHATNPLAPDPLASNPPSPALPAPNPHSPNLLAPNPHSPDPHGLDPPATIPLGSDPPAPVPLGPDPPASDPSALASTSSPAYALGRKIPLRTSSELLAALHSSLLAVVLAARFEVGSRIILSEIKNIVSHFRRRFETSANVRVFYDAHLPQLLGYMNEIYDSDNVRYNTDGAFLQRACVSS